ncbi:HlyD family efflux transporter periplasmic adaptor subunit [Marinilabiliaceae bacterium JC017]|nr:HlyD family efflux transporter periplasmic adaptor subunit [Marinilabiliaceae bacterium JC017]
MIKQHRIRLISWSIGIVGCIILLYLIFRPSINQSDFELSVRVEKKNFTAIVFSSGQLHAENSVSINVPSELSSRRLGIYEIKVTQLVEEGTVVDSGGFVASLDHGAVEEAWKNALDDKEKALNGYEDAKVDTTINLNNLRDELLDSRVSLEEKELILEQSIYESPAVKRQARLDVERARRALDQKLRNYDLKKQQEEYKVIRAREEAKRVQDRVSDIKKLFEALEVKAPALGMVIYSFDRAGAKIKVGSTVSPWNPKIAELPDLTSLISKTFINEIDISKIQVGQKVKVGIDAFPHKQFDGEIVNVANIGQVIPGGDAKVFEVIIKIFGFDVDLKPGMTTSNAIVVDKLEDVLVVPLDAVFDNDTSAYVILKKNRVWGQQLVEKGPENENHVVILKGVNEADELSLTEKENDKLPVWPFE